MSKVLIARVYFYDGGFAEKQISNFKDIESIFLPLDAIKIVVFDKICDSGQKANIVKRYYIGDKLTLKQAKKLYSDSEFLNFLNSLDEKTKLVIGFNNALSVLNADDKIIPQKEIIDGYWCPLTLKDAKPGKKFEFFDYTLKK